MKRVSLSELAVNAPAAPALKKTERRRAAKSIGEKGSKVTSDQANESTGNRVQVAFRMDKDAYRDLKRMALDEDTTVNELMVRAINELRERKGLKKLPE
jgi:hypothetical protein